MRQKVSPTQKVLNVWAIVLILWSIYRINFKTDLPPWFDEFIAKPIVFLLPIYFYIKRVEKKDFLQSIDLRSKNYVADIGIGFLIGLIFLMSGFIGTFIKNSGGNFFNHFSGINLVSVILLAFATSISEEILSRGFVLKRLYEESKNLWSSTFLASILFFFIHVPILFTNSKIVGFLLLQVMVTDLLLSFAVSILFLQRRSLVIAILIHALYNISLYLFI